MNVLPSSRRTWTLAATAQRALAVVASVGLVAVSSALPTASAAAPGALAICHATHSTHHPYITAHPSKTADAGGHAGHTGPVWSPTLAAGVAWGDIIPPFPITGGGTYPGLNWTVDGQEIYNNNCKPVTPNLKIVKTSSGNATVGTTGTYTIKVNNIGSKTAYGTFTVSDTMPTGVVATGASGAGWVCTVAALGASISCSYAADLAPTAVAADIIVSVNWVTAGSKANTATVTVLTGDPPANNTSTVRTTVAAIVLPNPIDVTLDKTNDGNGNGAFSDSEIAPAGGGNVTFRLVVTNPTAFDLTVDTLTDVVDANAAVALTCDPLLVQVGQTSLGLTIPPNSTRYCYWQTAGPANGASSTDQATIEVHETADPTNTDSDLDDTTVSRASFPVLSGDVDKTSDADGDTNWTDNETTTSAAGSTVSYRAVITNYSSVPVGVALSDTYGPGPAGTGTTIVPTCAPAAPATLDAAGGPNDSFTCNFSVSGSSPAAGASTVDTFTASLSRAGSVTVAPDDKATVRKAAANPTATVTKTNDANGDQAFGVNEEAPAVGQPVRFKLHITNTSPYAINVAETISDAYTLSTDGQSGNERAPLSFSCLPLITNLAPSQSADCYFTADSYAPADGVTKSNIATVTLTKYVAPGGSLRRTGTAAVVANFTASSLASTVKTTVPTPPPPPPLTPVLTPATAVAPSATLSTCSQGAPTAASYTVPSTTGVIYSPATGGTSAAGTSVTVTASAAPGYVLSGPSSFTLNFGPAPDCSVPGEDVGVSKTGPGSAHPGDELVYSVTVTNVKGTPATGFTVTDVVPVGLAIGSVAGQNFACALQGQTITCTYGGSLSVGQSASFTVRALLDSAFTGNTIGNTAVVDPRRADTDLTNNTSTATTSLSPLPAQPISGGGGGEATGPAPKPVVGGTGGAATGPQIPFTGSYAERMFQAGVSLLLLGLFLSLIARRRRVASA